MVMTDCETGQWYVYALAPRDHFVDVTFSIRDYIAEWLRAEAASLLTSDALSAAQSLQDEYLSAASAAVQHPLWESDGLLDGRVVYDMACDCRCYLFKITNNGTTFVVAPFPLPHLDLDSLDRGPVLTQAWSRERYWQLWPEPEPLPF